jgi:hypothetical protein
MSPQRARLLTWYLRLVGAIDCLAVVVALMPRSWIAASHAWLGLGTFPAEPIAGYLARSTSLMYVMHGLMVLYLAQDVRRYEWVIRFSALLAIVHGAMLLWIDWLEGLPVWWTWTEGPLFAASGVVALLIMGRREQR